MERSEAIKIGKERARAKREYYKYKKLLWKGSLSDPNREIYQARYDQAAIDLENVRLTYKQALRLFI